MVTLHALRDRLNAMTPEERREIADHAHMSIRQVDRIRGGYAEPRYTAYFRLVHLTGLAPATND